MNIDILDVKERVEAVNDRNAAEVRAYLKEKKVYLVNVMSSPGAGKTTALVRTINALKDTWKIGVMEADVDSVVDADTIQALTGAKVIQLHTGGSCHMDAGMTMDGLKKMNLDELDVVFLENVGNLVCPAEFDTGADLKVEILSVPEGDDKPLKYPLMFREADVVLENKMDTAPIFDYNADLAEERIRQLNPDCVFFRMSALNGDGAEAWTEYLRKRITEAGL
jgi:hydrogenase nickel incorporation protein HypB